jgi:hypothetical protein
MSNQKAILIIYFLVGFSFFSCKKTTQEDPAPVSSKIYSLKDFHKNNGEPMQKFTLDAQYGTTYSTLKGTIVRIPENCFTDLNGNLVSGTVTIYFKDIYSKSDMLLNDVSTTYSSGLPLKSAGEFFINALSGNQPLKIAATKNIEIQQPFKGDDLGDANMKPMVIPDTVRAGVNNDQNLWFVNPNADLIYTASSYFYSLYQFSGKPGKGNWCNSDNSEFFSSYTLTNFTVKNISGYNMEVFLVFKGVNTMVHVYRNGNDNVYNYAPVNQECTVVTIATDKDGKLYSSFIDHTITSNSEVTPVLAQTSVTALKTMLQTLD